LYGCIAVWVLIVEGVLAILYPVSCLDWDTGMKSWKVSAVKADRKGRRILKRNLLLFALSLLLVMYACGEQGPVKRSWGKMKGLENIVGNLNDTSYSSGRTQQPRPNALGDPVSMIDFEGRFIWSEYAATWCPVCSKQTPETQKVERELGEEIVFLTVMTGNSNAYNDHATVATAKQWAGRFNLEPERVIAAELWFKTVPEHRLYSPEGHTLFVHVGYLSAEQIREVIDYYKTGWEHWKATGERAEWMKYR
jgi:thiol-disulfide isomerase/thioredoxin